MLLVGRSGVGKTTLLEATVASLKSKGLRVLAVKSSHHRFKDEPGSDSYRLAQAGAGGVALLSASGGSLFLDPPLSLEEILPVLASRYDVALVEGGKSSSYPKVELVGKDAPLLSSEQVLEHLPRGEKAPCAKAVLRLIQLLEFDERLAKLKG